jgi:hypothetical protein
MRGCYCTPCCHDDRRLSEAEEHLLASSHDTPERGRTTFQDMYFFSPSRRYWLVQLKLLFMIRIVRMEKQKGRF